MKKNIVHAVFFVCITLLLPFLLTQYLTRHSSGSSLPNIDSIQIISSSSDQSPITFDDYVKGIVLASIPSSYEYETLKAQAVIARTYALKNISICSEQRKTTAIVDSISSKSKAYMIKDLGLPYLDPRSFLSSSNSSDNATFLSRVEQAVLDTKDEVITYKNELITPLYCSSSGGTTRDSSELWSVSIPYLKSVDSEYDLQSPNYMKLSMYTVDSVIAILQQAYANKTLDASEYDYQLYDELSIDSSNFFDAVTIIKRDSSGYVLDLSLGDVRISGEAFANALSLNSSYFYMDEYDNRVRIICNGTGHGFGFSQYGANILTKSNGFSYIQLLQHYYTNVKIQKVRILY